MSRSPGSTRSSVSCTCEAKFADASSREPACSLALLTEQEGDLVQLFLHVELAASQSARRREVLELLQRDTDLFQEGPATVLQLLSRGCDDRGHGDLLLLHVVRSVPYS